MQSGKKMAIFIIKFRTNTYFLHPFASFLLFALQSYKFCLAQSHLKKYCHYEKTRLAKNSFKFDERTSLSYHNYYFFMVIVIILAIMVING